MMRVVLESRASAILHRVLTSRGDERRVLLPSNVCAAVPMTVLAAGLDVEFVDIDPATLELDLAACAARLAAAGPGRYGTVIFVRPYGAVRDVKAQMQHLRDQQSDVMIIDDRCLCDPGRHGGDGFDAADVRLFSTGSRKFADLGGGGFGLLRDSVSYHEHRLLPPRRGHEERMEAMVREALASGRTLDHAEVDALAWISGRPVTEDVGGYMDRVEREASRARSLHASHDTIYREGIPADVCLPSPLSTWRFNVVLNRSGEALERLFAAGLFASRHYPDLAPAFGSPRSETAAAVGDHVVNLFNDRNVDVAMAARTAEVISDHVRRTGVPALAKDVVDRR